MSPAGPPADPLAAVTALPGVAEAAAVAREAVDGLLASRVLRRSSALVSAESALRAARASAALEGADVPLDEVRRAVRDGRPLPAEHAATLRGALRVTAELGALVATWERAPLQALARLHVLAAADRLPPEEVGRPRADATGLVAARLDALAGVLARPTAAPALVLAAVVHGELLALRPFAWGSGLVARAASRLVLVSRGVDPKAVSVPEVGHVELGPAAYDGALLRYREGTPGGVAAWVGHCAEAVALGAREGLAVCAALERGS